MSQACVECGMVCYCNKREIMIEEYIAACTECGGRGFPKRSDCDGCINAVDECLAEMAQSVSSDADRYAAATRAIATGDFL